MVSGHEDLTEKLGMRASEKDDAIFTEFRAIRFHGGPDYLLNSRRNGFVMENLIREDGRMQNSAGNGLTLTTPTGPSYFFVRVRIAG